MSHACKECWEPVHEPEEDLCDWCRMTEAERHFRTRRAWRIIIGGLIVTAILILHSHGAFE